MFQVIVSGTVIGEYATREGAEVRLEEVKHSFLALVHPRDTMYIKEVTE